MGKANISFPNGMLEEVDRRAAATGTTRSAFLQEATASYLARLDADVERSSRTSRTDRALARMAEIGKDIPPGPDGATMLRRLRDAVPDWARNDATDE